MLFRKLKTLRLYFLKRKIEVIEDEGLKKKIVEIQHKVPRDRSVIFEYNGKFYKIKELG
jgi:hypothetical protein